MHRTHLPRSSVLERESTQLIGHALSQIPHDTHPLLIRIPRGATPEIKPRTNPTGHQSQNLLPLAAEKANTMTNIAMETADTT
jgi:hypothetical protein